MKYIFRVFQILPTYFTNFQVSEITVNYETWETDKLFRSCSELKTVASLHLRRTFCITYLLYLW